MKRDAQRRLSERASLAAEARILDGESCVIDCKTIDLSCDGARLEVPRRSRIPSRFTLCVPSRGIERRAEVVWSADDQLGVHFLFETAEVPDLQTLSPPVAAPKPRKIEPDKSDGSASRGIDDREIRHGKLQTSVSEPFGFGSILRQQVFGLALVIIGAFGALVFVASKVDLRGPTNGPAPSTGFVVGNGHQRDRQILTSEGQTGEAGATFGSVRAIGAMLRRTFDRNGSTTSSHDVASDNRPIGGSFSPAPGIGRHSESPPRLAQPQVTADEADTRPVASRRLIAEVTSSVPFRPSPAAAASDDADATAKDAPVHPMTGRREPSAVRTIEGCLAAAIDTTAARAWQGPPTFVFADACLRDPGTAKRATARVTNPG